MLSFITPNWPTLNNIEVFTTLRTHGYSQGAYSAFNPALHVNDQPEHVLKNRALLTQHLNSDIHWLEQTHSADIIDLDSAESNTQPHLADAVITTLPDTVCAVMTADCLPIVIVEQQANMVSIAHAGWKGLHAGIIDKLCQRILDKGFKPEQLQAWIGPAISQPCYEVTDHFKSQFNAWTEEAFLPSRAGHWQANLSALGAWKLKQLGIEKVYCSPLCTYQDHRLFSHRKTNPCGRNVTIARITHPVDHSSDF